jgi:Sec-independent protein translocase protein TatA
VGPELLLLLLVLIVVLVWRGPTSLPRLGEALGKAVKGARDNMPSRSSGEPDDQEPSGPSASDGSPGAGPRPE